MGYNEYEITLPNGEKVYVYFIGPQLKKVLDAYKVNYKIKTAKILREKVGM